MFGSRLKKELVAKDAELSLLRQLYHGIQTEMIKLTVDSQYRIIDFNANFASFVGYGQEQLSNRPMSEIVPSYVKTLPCFRNLQEAMRTGRSVRDRYRFVRSDGALVWMQACWLPVVDDKGVVTEMQCFGSEITESMNRARENEDFINALLRSTAVIEFDLNGTVLNANDQFLQAMGYGLDRIKGKHHSLFCESQETNSIQYKQFWSGSTVASSSPGGSSVSIAMAE